MFSNKAISISSLNNFIVSKSDTPHRSYGHLKQDQHSVVPLPVLKLNNLFGKKDSVCLKWIRLLKWPKIVKTTQ